MKYFSVINGLENYLLDVGIDLEKVLLCAGLSDNFFINPNKVINENTWYKLIGAIHAQLSTGNEVLDFVDKCGLRLTPKIFLLGCTSDNGEEFLKRYVQYHGLVSPYCLTFEANNDICQLILTVDEKYPSVIQFMEFLNILHFLRYATQRCINPVAVEIKGRFSDDRTLQYFFRSRVTIGERNTVCFDKKDMSIPFIGLNQKVWQFLEPKIAEELEYLDEHSFWTKRVSEIIVDSFLDEVISLESIALKLNISARTLQRYLEKENTSFKAILKYNRIKLAKFYLKYTEIPLQEIAFRLGYKESTSFIHAFREWTGKTCNNYRNDKNF